MSNRFCAHDMTLTFSSLHLTSDGVWDTMSSDLVAKFTLVNTCKIIDKSLQVGEY